MPTPQAAAQQQGSSLAVGTQLQGGALPACLRQLHASAGGLQAAAAAAAEPEPVPHAVWEEGELTSAQLTPRQVVEMLDRYIVGQGAAKKAVANALRNRWRRHKVPSPLRVRWSRRVGGCCEGAFISNQPVEYAGDCMSQVLLWLPRPIPQPTPPPAAPHRRRRSTPRTCS